jgi:hypothetical protein
MASKASRKLSKTAEFEATDSRSNAIAVSRPRQRRSKTIAVSAAMPLPFNLTDWSETQYVIPSALLRSALFGVLVKNRPRPHLKSKRLATVDDFQLYFTGEAFDQSDEDVWMGLLKFAKHRGMGTLIPFTLRGMLRELNWDPSGKSITRLKQSFERLVEGTLKIQVGTNTYRGHLVDSIESNELVGEEYVFHLNPNMALLFSPEMRTGLQSAHRKKIRGTLAKWLHGFVEASPLSYFKTSLQQCYEVSGSSFREMARFKFALKKALEELVACDVIESWHFDRELVIIQRSPSSMNDRLRSVTPVTALS